MQRASDTNPFSSFAEAARAVLEHLQASIGFDLWMVTRIEGEDWIVLQAVDRGDNVNESGVPEGSVFRWTDSYCARMVLGQGPRIAPRADDVPAYREAPLGDQLPIGAYVGVPLHFPDGRLFGTLCAFHPEPRPQEVAERLPEIELFARLLSGLLQAEISSSHYDRRAERAQLEELTDELTGLFNRRGWDRLLEAEEARCRRYGHPASLFSFDVDDLQLGTDSHGSAKSDEFLKRVAKTIKGTVRGVDVVARLGDHEFGLLAIECDALGSKVLQARLEKALADADLAVSIGVATSRTDRSFASSWERAEQARCSNGRQHQACDAAADPTAVATATV